MRMAATRGLRIGSGRGCAPLWAGDWPVRAGVQSAGDFGDGGGRGGLVDDAFAVGVGGDEGLGRRGC